MLVFIISSSANTHWSLDSFSTTTLLLYSDCIRVMLTTVFKSKVFPLLNIMFLGVFGFKVIPYL